MKVKLNLADVVEAEQLLIAYYGLVLEDEPLDKEDILLRDATIVSLENLFKTFDKVYEEVQE